MNAGKYYWYGTKEAFVAKPQARHLSALQPDTHVEVFPGMNHGQLLVDHPEVVAGDYNVLVNDSDFHSCCYSHVRRRPRGALFK